MTSKELELQSNDLAYDMQLAQELDETEDVTIDEGEEDGEESKFAGLSGEFGRESDSRVEDDMDSRGKLLVGGAGELSELDGAGMNGGNSEAEYAEIDTGT